MIAARARLLNGTYVVSDLLATTLALGLAYTLRGVVPGDSMPFLSGSLPPFAWYLPVLALVLLLWPLVFYTLGLYGRHGRTLDSETSVVLTGIVVAGLLLIAVIFTARLSFISRPVVVAFLLFDFVFVVGLRRLVRALLVQGGTPRRVLVAGGRDQVRAAAALVDGHRDWGLEVGGIVTDGRWQGEAAERHPVLGSYRDLLRLVQEQHAAEVLIAPATGQLDDLQTIDDVIGQLEAQGTVVRLAMNFLPRSVSQLSFDQLGDFPLLTFSAAPSNEVQLAVRRVADVLIAIFLLGLLSPVLLGIAIGIGFTSPGPVLFRQARCGLHGRRFTFLKFRTMRTDAERLKPLLQAFNEMDGPAFKMTNDPRVFPFGGFLRRTSLDELPQLWNILRGDMSFVGPRPSVVEEVNQYEPWQRRRLSMKPGLTCLWQVSGRNELTFEEWMRLDLEYIDNWSLWLDVKIAFKTVPAVLVGRGAR
ncbi:MAG: sugar transferase [Luteitalea sp.]|nr:sugar transferase [Acidobacteriota bacterium]